MVTLDLNVVLCWDWLLSVECCMLALCLSMNLAVFPHPIYNTTEAKQNYITNFGMLDLYSDVYIC